VKLPLATQTAMNESSRSPEQTAPAGSARWFSFRIALALLALGVVLTVVFIGVSRWRRSSIANTSDPYAAVPFRPKVTYEASNVSVSNTETEPYLDARLIVYVGAVVYSAQIGTIRPGETVTRSLRGLTNEQGESFDPTALHKSELEVRARFGGYDVHKDFPAPR
jgi:hypothetical protein